MNVLVFLDYFTPAYKAGGPIRIFEFLTSDSIPEGKIGIVTQNTDWGDSHPLAIEANKWIDFDKATVIYLDRNHRGTKFFKSLVSEFDSNIVHLNSVFSRTWTMKLLFLRRFGSFKQAFFISPHGELASSALAHKAKRKAFYLTFAKMLGLFKNLTWIATSAKEVEEIKRVIGPLSNVVLVPPPLPKPVKHKAAQKIKGKLKLIFLARISAMKNLSFLTGILPHVKGEIEFDIYGPIDKEFESEWNRIFALFQSMGPRVNCKYKGPIPSSQSIEILSNYDLFVQPSLSENFGYSIVEALAAGTPVLISDRTPWNEVNSFKIGSAIPLDQHEAWIQSLNFYLEMDTEIFHQTSSAAQKWVLEKNKRLNSMVDAYRNTGG